MRNIWSEARRLSAIQQALSMQHRGETRGTASESPLAGPVYVDRSKIADCNTCGKTGAKLQELKDKEYWECSHVECPTRKPLTANVLRNWEKR